MQAAAMPFLGLLVTLAVFLGCQKLQSRLGGHPLANPVALAIFVLATGLVVFRVSYGAYFASVQLLHLLLGPATVALAVPLVRELPRLKRLAWPVASGLVAGNLTAALSAMALTRLLGGSRELMLTMAPKSVTTPIAMGISEKLGGQPSLTATLVIATGVLGAMVAPWLLDRLGILDPAVRGLATGVAAHGIGTARMAQESSEAAAYSGLAMGLSGLLTALILPGLVRFF